ncbi:MAG: ABC-type transport auxiliary lipoprotein family protein [Beijerinckiaceae bacterium]
MQRRDVLLGLSTLALAGCGGGPAPSTFDLSSTRPRASGRGATLVVAEPTAVSALDSERIVVKAATGELTYLPRAQWSDRLPRLVQARLIQSFENAGRVAVGRPVDRLSGAFNLVLDIRAFEAREASRDAVVEIAAKLVTAAGGEVRAARLFAAAVPVGGIDGQGVSRALDAALARVLADIVGWAG